MILRIDDVIATQKSAGGPPPGAEGGMPPGMGGMGGMLQEWAECPECLTWAV